MQSHFARAFQELQCTVRVISKDISAARFGNAWPVHSANFENGMETGLIIMIDLSLSFIFRIGNLTKSDRRSSM